MRFKFKKSLIITLALILIGAGGFYVSADHKIILPPKLSKEVPNTYWEWKTNLSSDEASDRLSAKKYWYTGKKPPYKSKGFSLMDFMDKVDEIKAEIECKSKSDCRVLNFDLPQGHDSANVGQAFYDKNNNLYISLANSDYSEVYFYKNNQLITSVPTYYGSDGPVWNFGLLNGGLTFEYITNQPEDHEQRKEQKIVMNIYYQGELMNDKFNLKSSKELFIYKNKIGFIAQKKGGYFIWFNGQKVSDEFDSFRTHNCCASSSFLFDLYENGILHFGAVRGNVYYLSEVNLNKFL